MAGIDESMSFGVMSAFDKRVPERDGGETPEDDPRLWPVKRRLQPPTSCALAYPPDSPSYFLREEDGAAPAGLGKVLVPTKA